MLLLGIDVGTSSIKVSVVDAQTQVCVASAQYPDTESAITSRQPGWAEQAPDMWWQHVQQAIRLLQKPGLFNPADIGTIGIAYQMHGLVLVDKAGNALRDSIIWCDSRAVAIGDKAFDDLGHEQCLSTLLNSPGNFTASKLAWVKANEPEIYAKIDKVMLPGDYIALKMCGTLSTSASALSEGIFYDFATNNLSTQVLNYFGFSTDFFAPILPVFAEHGRLLPAIAQQLNLTAGIPVAYKAGDQPNNALSLNVLNPGEVAATAGTSGVIYGVTDGLATDPQSRVNTFAHVNHSAQNPRLGVLLCINGAGSLNRWTKSIFGGQTSYQQMNDEASQIAPGSDGLRVLPFGNGAERVLNNKIVGVHFHHIGLNLHTRAHLMRAVQEGIAFSFRYGLDIMRQNGMNPTVIRAGHANLFLSSLFTQAFVNATGVPVELYKNDGSVGAALGAGIGAGVYSNPAQAFSNMQVLKTVEPSTTVYNAIYAEWLALLQKQLAAL